MGKFFLLDAMALIYRAHFAFSKNPRISSKGQNTGAILGFTNTLVEVIRKEKPTHIAVAFDTPEPTFRHESFEAYKANREEQPEDITQAIPYVKEIIRAFQIPVLELGGYEADDIIGTIAKQASQQGVQVFMMTPDKDYSQLVEENILLYKPAFMGNGVDILGVPEVLAKWDIDRIDQVVDVLGLQGDAVDNIPGIPGIGPKTASKLLKQFDSVENIVANADQLKGKQREKVIEFGDQGILSKELAKIHIEVPIDWDLAACVYDGPDKERLTALFQELEFRTLQKRIFGEEAPKVAQKTVQTTIDFGVQEQEIPVQQTVHNTIETTFHDYQLIDQDELIEDLLTYLLAQKEVCFDTETTNISGVEAKLIGIAFSYNQTEAYYVPIPTDPDEAIRKVNLLKPFFEHEHIIKIGQNVKYDQLVLKKYGVTVKGPFFDTMLAHYLLYPDQRHNMDVLAENYLNYKPVSITELIGKKGKNQGSMEDVPVNEVVEYACEDADITLQLKHAIAPELPESLVKLLDTIELPLISILSDMENEGVRIDTDTLADLSNDYAIASKKVEQKIYEAAGEVFNIASPKQLGEILFDKLKLIEKPKKTKTGQYATGEEILSKLAYEHQIARDITEFRELQKLKSTYIDALPNLISSRDNRVHTSYNQAVAATGRLSSTDPNLQNIPIRTAKGREIRKAFVPRDQDHILLAADYSQIELRIIAALAKDENMISAFKDKKDIHAMTASKLFQVPEDQVDADMRRKAKTANFGIIYGISAFGLSQRLNIPRKEAGVIITSYFKEFPKIKAYMDYIINVAREQGYVETIFGRRRYLRDINSRNYTTRSFAERNAINAPIQGSAADIIKLAMIEIHKWMQKQNLASKMILQVHDELVFDVHKKELSMMESEIPKLMEGAYALEVPLEVNVGTGQNWLDAH